MMTTADNAGDGDVTQKQRRFSGQTFALIGVVAVAVGALAWMNYSSGLPRDLRTCDEIIKTRLMAPSTYRRIDSGSFYSEQGVYLITYEAVNAFGVPLRSKGLCGLNGDRSSGKWTKLD